MSSGSCPRGIRALCVLLSVGTRYHVRPACTVSAGQVDRLSRWFSWQPDQLIFPLPQLTRYYKKHIIPLAESPILIHLYEPVQALNSLEFIS